MYAMCYVTCFDLGFRVVCVCVCGGIQVGMGERIQVGMGPLGISHNRSWGGGAVTSWAGPWHGATSAGHECTPIG